MEESKANYTPVTVEDDSTRNDKVNSNSWHLAPR